MKAESGVKTETGIKVEQVSGHDADCYIDKIDYSKKIPNFTNVPTEVVKAELTLNGIRTCQINKTKRTEKITIIWQYRKHGELPLKYVFEEDEEGGDILQPFH